MTYGRGLSAMLGLVIVLSFVGMAYVVSTVGRAVEWTRVQSNPTPAADVRAGTAPSESQAAPDRAVVTASEQPPAPGPTATPEPERGPIFILLRAEEVTADARLNFLGQGFLNGEKAAVTVEDAQGHVEARLDTVNAAKDGRIDEVSVPVPSGLAPGPHVLRIAGTTSGRSARATFRLRWLPPKITLNNYTAKAEHTFGFSGNGFAPGEHVDVRLGGLGGAPLASFQSDAQGNVLGRDVLIPLVQPGDYPLYFVGRESQSPVSVGFNVQGFKPWVVLDNYSPPPYYHMGFKGEDFVPGERVQAYLGQRGGQPVAQVAADPHGQFNVKDAFELPELPKGDNRLIFVGEQSGAEISANFVALPFGPSLELSVYAGRTRAPVAFIGSSWARSEVLHAYAGEQRQPVGTFQADASGAFHGAGSFRLPLGLGPGGVPLTVIGDVSQAEVTLWFQVLELKPSAELTAYEGPPGTVVSFTGRSFAGGERVRVRLRDRGGRELASAVADDAGTFEHLSSYPVEGDWGAAIPFVLVGDESGAEAMTHFKIATP